MKAVLTMLLVVAAVLVVVRAQCGDGEYGADCSCTSDVPEMLTNAGGTHSGACAGRTWTITGPGKLNIGNAEWYINTDRVRIVSDFEAGDTAQLHWTVNGVSPGEGGELTIVGNATITGYGNFFIANFSDEAERTSTLFLYRILLLEASIRVSYLRYPSRDNVKITPNSPKLAEQFAKCWELGKSVSNITASVGYLQVSLAKKEGVSCDTGTQDRRWVIAFIVLLVVWGLMFGIIWYVTCKVDKCKDMFWEK